MAPPTYQQKDKLVEVSQEGFALLDEYYARSEKSGVRIPTNQCTYVYHGPQIITVKAPVIDSNQAVQFYSGMEVVDHKKGQLVDVGLEGFALLDEFYGRPKKSGGRLPTNQAYDHHQIHRQFDNYNQLRDPEVITIREPVINSNQAAQFYGGMRIADYSIKNPVRKAY